jgi:hypothetical protein
MHEHLTSRSICQICPLVASRTSRLPITKPEYHSSNIIRNTYKIASFFQNHTELNMENIDP